MEFLKIKQLEHSGIGDGATHIKVMNEFRESEENGIKYCEKRGWRVTITDILLKVESSAIFGFKFSALIKR